MNLNPFRRRTRFVNEGDDPRLEGPLGELGARLQRQLSFFSTVPPKRIVFHRGAWGHVAVYDPFFISVFLKREDGLWWSFRIGKRWDANWGDGNNAYEPAHTPPGGYIADVIVKTHR